MACCIHCRACTARPTKTTMNDTPNFAAWTNENLAKFALDAYLRLQAQQDAIEQLRGDLKDAMKLIRQIQRPDA